MKLPEKIKGRNRIRDAAIVVAWSREDLSTNTIAEKFKLTQRRIEQILRANHAFVTIDKEWEKKKRLKIINRLIDKKKDESFKDVSDLLEQQRKEIEGDEPSSRTQETKVIIIRESNGNQNSSRDVPGQISVLRV